MEAAAFPELSSKQKAETLQALASGPLTSSIAKLSASSRAIPSDKDFHFFNNFPEFKNPIKDIAEKSELMLQSIGSSSHLLFGNQLSFPDDPDDYLDWMVNVNDEILERFDVSIDEFQRIRKEQEETGGSVGSLDAEGGFQVVYGKKKRGGNEAKAAQQDSAPKVKVASKDQKVGASRKVPFHIPSIPRPQDRFNILVNNANQPFEHVWLQKSEDSSRFIHPLENISESDFVDRDTKGAEPVKPLPLESTPFKLVEEVKDLKELAIKLSGAKEFAVDLEHNQYRSFQGLTCLMQISTRTEDFVLDTLKLRVHVGPYLREVFKDPHKRKVMHGADKDILWLQRDFGIYVCNLFDTGQASRVLQLERNSLEYLLHYFCGVTANKEYQNAEWRLRPLPEEMIKYAREDTHYLLYIYDLMRDRLLSESNNSDSLLLEVYKRSYDICMQLYEKELLTDTSYLHIYGLLGADFNSEQLAVVAGLSQWRDVVARQEDESTGYILPNKTLLEIARQLPVSAGKLRRLLKSKHPFVERNVGSVVSIIKSSIANAVAFQAVSEQLKKAREETALQRSVAIDEGDSGVVPITKDPMSVDSSSAPVDHIVPNDHPMDSLEGSSNQSCIVSSESMPILSQLVQVGEMDSGQESLPSVKPAAVVSIEMRKKPNNAFGMMLGNSKAKRKVDQDKVENKLEQIKSSVSLPFHSFSGTTELSKPVSHESAKIPLAETVGKTQTCVPDQIEDIVPLECNSDDENEESENPTTDHLAKQEESCKNGDPESETDMVDDDASLVELASGFQDIFQSLNQKRQSKQYERKQGERSETYPPLKPFDYAAARKQMRFGEVDPEKAVEGDENALELKESSRGSRLKMNEKEGTKDSQQARRRQAFPPSGNRSATFRQ
ncbi:protein RRP6-like 2 [Aristolochia californica]|uniref:protein RRP6-like 2 n=1 Tax=Aristolochia californica TaxID=171875 RepID=UPI0035DEC88E